MHSHEFSFFDSIQANAEPISRQFIPGDMGEGNLTRMDKRTVWRAERLALFTEDNKRRTPCTTCGTLVLPHLHEQHHEMLHPN